MSSTVRNWVELSSTNERIAQLTDSAVFSACLPGPAARSQWAELASQGERLVESGDPLFRLASSSHERTGMRLVASAA
jgi:hypothetical protein